MNTAYLCNLPSTRRGPCSKPRLAAIQNSLSAGVFCFAGGVEPESPIHKKHAQHYFPSSTFRSQKIFSESCFAIRLVTFCYLNRPTCSLSGFFHSVFVQLASTKPCAPLQRNVRTQPRAHRRQAPDVVVVRPDHRLLLHVEGGHVAPEHVHAGADAHRAVESPAAWRRRGTHFRPKPDSRVHLESRAAQHWPAITIKTKRPLARFKEQKGENQGNHLGENKTEPSSCTNFTCGSWTARPRSTMARPKTECWKSLG